MQPELAMVTPARFVAISADGAIVARLLDRTLSVGDHAVARDVVAAATVADAVWAVAGEALYRFAADGTPLAAPLPLGAIGDVVVMTAARVGSRTALIEGARAIEVREDAAGHTTIIELGARTADRRVLVPGRGVLERRGQQLVTVQPSGLAPLPLPPDAQRVIGGTAVLDGAAVMIEIEARNASQVLVYDLRGAALRTRVRLGDAHVLAVAERRSIVMLGRDSHLATLDLRQGRCINERVLARPVLAVAIDADGKRIVVEDACGTRALGAALTELDDVPVAEISAELPPVPAPESIPDMPLATGDDDPEVDTMQPGPMLPPPPVAKRQVLQPAPAPAPVAPIAPANGDELARYLEDVFDTITSLCLARATTLDDPRLPPAARVTNALSAAPTGADARTRDAFARLAAYASAPHREIATELGLSSKAALALLVVAAPQLWSEVARAYGAIGSPGRPLVDEMLVGELLGVPRAQRDELTRELDALVAAGVIVRADGARAFASLAAADGVVARLRGDRTALIGDAAAIAKIADQLPTITDWSSLVLPADVDESLRELVGRIRMRDTVLDAWGMTKVAPARGVTALFRGEPGTGKSLAASVISGALGLPLFRVDVSRVLSKWVGETERNLGALLDAAESGRFVILFDEADSLFGKRSEVESGSDHYANLEVNYLLQRLDRFNGIAILTTNFGTAIDPAFQRRLALDLQFPMPDEDARIRLWRAHVPASVPTAGELELAALAAEFPIAGGHIRNCTLRACYLAAAEAAPLRASHLRRAVELEYRDRGKLYAGGALV